jgi:uncharacterized protein YecT (DUF1311 family)
MTPPPYFTAAFLCGAALLLSPVIHAQSFDCKRATTVIEEAICDDAAVSNLDQRLAHTVKHLLVQHPEWGSQLLLTERHWIRSRDAACMRFAHTSMMGSCLSAQYTARLTVVESTQPLQDGSPIPDADKCDVLPNVVATSCLGNVAYALEPVLSEYYEVARASMRRSAAAAPGFAADDLNEAVVNLERAQAAWRAYRDAHCAMVADLYINGSGRAAGESTCAIRLTRSRIHELWEAGGFFLPEPK